MKLMKNCLRQHSMVESRIRCGMDDQRFHRLLIVLFKYSLFLLRHH